MSDFMYMICQAEPATYRARYTGWDALLVVVLGMMLLAAGWLDIRAYIAHRNRPTPQFAFLEPPGGERLGDDEIYRGGDSYVILYHMGWVENNPQGHIRQAYGPGGALLISTPKLHAALDIKYYNPVEGQDITITCDGRPVERFIHQPIGIIERKYVLDLRPGMNDVSIGFARYNHVGFEASATDDRPMAGSIVKLGLTLY